MKENDIVMPGVAVKCRPLNVYFLLDNSETKDGGLEYVVRAVESVLPQLARESEENEFNAEIYVRIMTFGGKAEWQSREQPATAYELKPLAAKGKSVPGAAFDLLAEHFAWLEKSKRRMLTPVIILVSASKSSDAFKLKLKQLLGNRIAKSAVRLSVAATQNADEELLNAFLCGEDAEVMSANEPEKIAVKLIYASIAGSKSAMSQSMMPFSDTAAENYGTGENLEK